MECVFHLTRQRLNRCDYAFTALGVASMILRESYVNILRPDGISASRLSRIAHQPVDVSSEFLNINWQFKCAHGPEVFGHLQR